jgi:uncharacterized protein (AIM24 family)
VQVLGPGEKIVVDPNSVLGWQKGVVFDIQ